MICHKLNETQMQCLHKSVGSAAFLINLCVWAQPIISGDNKTENIQALKEN